MPDWLWVGGWDLSAVEVAAPAPAIRLGPELPLKLHEAPDPGAIGADIRLDVGGQLAHGSEVDAEQLRAPLQRRRDRPAQVRVVPSPHPNRLSNLRSRSHRQCYRPQPDDRWGTLGAQSTGLHGSTADNPGKGLTW
jgi:hypothetical protein